MTDGDCASRREYGSPSLTLSSPLRTHLCAIHSFLLCPSLTSLISTATPRSTRSAFDSFGNAHTTSSEKNVLHIYRKTSSPTNSSTGLELLEKTIALRACLMCWTASLSKLVPREMQLQHVIGDRTGQNTLVSAGTGSGKTLPMALCILLDDPEENKVTLTLSPLKRLQITQEHDIPLKFGVPTLVINEDTPRQEAWWAASSINWSYCLVVLRLSA